MRPRLRDGEGRRRKTSNKIRKLFPEIWIIFLSRCLTRISTWIPEVVYFDSFYFTLPSSAYATPAFNQLISTRITISPSSSTSHLFQRVIPKVFISLFCFVYLPNQHKPNSVDPVPVIPHFGYMQHNIVPKTIFLFVSQ